MINDTAKLPPETVENPGDSLQQVLVRQPQEQAEMKHAGPKTAAGKRKAKLHAVPFQSALSTATNPLFSTSVERSSCALQSIPFE